MHLVIITGLSGAGKSHALNEFEDMGYYCVDNLPPSLIPVFVDLCRGRQDLQWAAVVVDIRGGVFLDDIFPALHGLKSKQCTYEILFLEATDDTLVRRYQETRRIHPLTDKQTGIRGGITRERVLLMRLKEVANRIVDTSSLNVKDFKRLVREGYMPGERQDAMKLRIMSFGFKNGMPAEADYIFDVRFVSNPFYVDTLRRHTGKEDAVKDYVLGFEVTMEFLNNLFEMMVKLMPNFMREGKNELTIAFGCTGGVHRSVVMADRFFEMCVARGVSAVIDHRDLDRTNPV